MINFQKLKPKSTSPSAAIMIGAPASPEDNCPCPTFYFTSDKEYAIPDEGTATIKFRKVKDSEDTKDPEDPQYNYELEVSSIDIAGMKDGNIELDSEANSETDVGMALKKGVRAMMAKKMEGM